MIHDLLILIILGIILQYIEKIIVEKENSLINSLLLMQMGLNLMNPPQPKLNCTTNLFGWTCY